MRALIVEDLALLRDGLERVLFGHGIEVATAADAEEFAAASAAGPPPDVCIVDVRLPPTFTDEGVRAALAARQRHTGLPILVLSQYVERTYAVELLAQGPGGSAICSRTGSPRSATSSTPFAGSPWEGPPSTPRRSASSSAPARAAVHSPS